MPAERRAGRNETVLYRFFAIAIPVAVIAAGAFYQFAPSGDESREAERAADGVDVFDGEVHRVERVIDGDSFVLADGTEVRLYGVQAPERGKDCHKEATERLEELVSDGVSLERGERLRHGDRVLAYAYTADGETFIDETLIEEGLAEAFARDGQHRHDLMEVGKQAAPLAEQLGCDFSR